MEFTESLTLELPKIDVLLAESADSATKQGIVLELAAIHEGMTANYNNYSAVELEKALESWVSPYPKPIIRNHDTSTEPLGRVMAASMAKEGDGTPYTRLRVAITDAEAMQKANDKRYLTGSVGGKAGQALCSICNVDWANASMFESAPCRHERGKIYKGKLAYFEMKDLSFKEYSFVNVPADQRSSIRSIASDGEDVTDSDEDVKDRWVKAHVFTVDMQTEAVTELMESGERNVLAGMKKREASPFYHVLRGAFLTTLALAEAEAEENELMPVEDDDDILAVTESLSDDLSVPEEEAPEEAPEEETPEETPEEDPEAPEAAAETEEPAEEAAPEDEETPEEEPSAADAPEEEAPEGQEDPADEDDTPDPTRENDAPEEEPAPEEEDTTKTNVEEDDERISALEAEVEALSKENAKLKLVLKAQLAERVVDTKIALGIEERENRDQLVSEHADRTASSLADSIRDLAKHKPVQRDVSEAPEVQPSSLAVGDDGERVLTTEAEEEETAPPKPPQDQVIEALTDVFMNRRKIN